jgi:hypothetical protein
MDNVNGQTFGPQQMVDTDGRAFTDCTFDSASLVYRGGEHPAFERCTFNGRVTWHFLGSALKTIQLLQRLANDEGGENFIAALFQKGTFFADEGAVAG